MGYAEDIIKQILNEEVTQNYVSHAIRKRHVVSFKYDDEDGSNLGKQERIIVCPCVMGVTSAGNIVFRGYQKTGSSKSVESGKKGKELPGWRMFRIDRVVSGTWKDSGKVFRRPPDYNEEGDRGLGKENILVQANFTAAKERYERGGLQRYNQVRRMAKDYEYGGKYDFARQVERPLMAPEYVQRNIEFGDRQKEDLARYQSEYDDALRRSMMGGNDLSVNDMKRQSNFGDEETQDTIGPVYKGTGSQTDGISKPVPPRMDYEPETQNGPQFKRGGKNDNDNEETEEE